MKKKKNELLELIRTLLEMDETCKDDDMELIAKVWASETSDSFYITGLDFLLRVMSSEVSSPESIRRRRQLLQAKYPELRGTKYEERRVYSKKYREHVIKGEINELA
jgi:hypothetical protein